MLQPGLRYVIMLSVLFGSFTAVQGSAQMQAHTHMAATPTNSSQVSAVQAKKDVLPGVTRIYFIAAVEVDWDYSPNGKNMAGTPHTENEDDESGGSTHRVYHKAVYKEYTDATFKTIKTRPQQWEHLGLLGPLIRAEVGDSVRVTFKNNTHLSVTMHPHGLEYKKDAEGALYQDGTSQSAKADDKIPPGGTYVYLWTVPESSGPAEMDGSSVLWMYHSHFVESTDINTGLVGPIIVTARGQARADGSPKDVDREFITDFSIFDETNSWFSEKNTSRQPNFRSSATDPAFLKQNTLYSINGYIEANLPLVTMRKGERVRWYLLSNSNENDIHMAHWHGNTVVWNKMRMDSVFLGPMAMAIADMVPTNEGIWLFHCHVGEHFLGGMVGRYQVLP